MTTDYHVVFDGTSAREWGRQIFVPEQKTTLAPATVERRLGEARRRYTPQEDGVRERVLDALRAGPQTAFELSDLLKINDDLVRNAVTRLRGAGEVDVVDSQPNPNAGERGQRRYLLVYGVRP